MINGINHITLAVNNIEESFAFYTEVLGLKKIMKSDFSGYAVAGLTWIAFKQDNVSKREDYSHIAFNVERNNYDKLVSKLKKYGVKEWQENNTEGESFYFLDPNGNKLEIHYSTLEKRIKAGKANWGNTIEWYI